MLDRCCRTPETRAMPLAVSVTNGPPPVAPRARGCQTSLSPGAAGAEGFEQLHPTLPSNTRCSRSAHAARNRCVSTACGDNVEETLCGLSVCRPPVAPRTWLFVRTLRDTSCVPQ